MKALYEKLVNHSDNTISVSEVLQMIRDLEPKSEPRMFSEEEVIGFGIWLGEDYWFNLSTYKWEHRNIEGLYEVIDSKQLIELYIQSLSPKEEKEEVTIKEDINSIINKLDTPEGLDQYSYDEGFKEGYKAAQSKGRYSEEEVANMKAALITAKNRMEEDAKCCGESGLLPEDVVYSTICEAIRYDGAKTEFTSQPIEPTKWDKLNKEFDEALDHAKNNGYFEKLSILPESSNPIATDHTTLSPNQTEAEKEVALTIYIRDKHTQEECIGFIDGYDIGYSLARKQVIEEIEGWAKGKSIGKVYIFREALLTKLQTLKK